MKAFAALAAGLAVLSPVFSVSPAQAKCEDSISYIVVPNRCFTLDHIHMVNASRSRAATENRAYRKEIDANIAMDNSAANLKFETKEERDARYRDLAKQSIRRDITKESYEEAKAIAFRYETYVLNQISGVLAPKR